MPERLKLVSLQSALNFIRRFRAGQNAPDCDPEFTGITSIEQLLGLAKTLGWEFSLDELREAHAHDWQLRWQLLNHGDSSRSLDRFP